MGHTPYGYNIVGGNAEINEEQAARVRKLFEGYISGLALVPAAEAAGINGKYHGSVGRILRNRRYLGDDYYPAIIDQETFDKAEELRQKKMNTLGRVHVFEEKQHDILIPKFTMPRVQTNYTDPYLQAAYAYSLIETEETNAK